MSREFKDVVRLGENIVMFPGREVGHHGNVYEGEVRSSVYGVRQCVIKFAALSEQNVRETEILTKLGSHTNVIALIQSGTYHDVFEDRVYIALDKCHNENLRQYLANRKSADMEYDLNQAVDFAKQIVAGVTYIHDNNVIHLDLKPSNILISQNLRLIKIADFGLSIVVKSPNSKVLHKSLFGTNGYRPIESFGNGIISQRTDIFSLGAVLFHLLSNGKEIFSGGEHAFFNNVMNDITDTSGLLVCNPLTTEHLIKCMVSKERCRRPTIWEVSDHPCWSGKEAECDFEYLGDEEVDDVSDREKTADDTMAMKPTGNDREFLKKMEEMGFNREPTIAVFDRFTRFIFRVDPETNKLTEMRETTDQMNAATFRAITFDEHIYVFMDDHSVYRLEYCDVTARWERMRDIIGNHGDYPQAVVASKCILLVGGSGKTFTKSISRFNPNENYWDKLKDMTAASSNSALLVSKDNLYCFGGATKHDESSNRVERLDLATSQWFELESMTNRRHGASAVEYNGLFYVIGGIASDERLNTAELYDPVINQWSALKPTNISRAYFRSYAIGNSIFAVVGDQYPRTIEMYDTLTGEWKIVRELWGLRVHDAVLLMMSQ